MQGVSDSTITINIDGESLEIQKRLDDLQALMGSLQATILQAEEKQYPVTAISEANFKFILAQVGHDNNLPKDLANSIHTEENLWVKSLYQEMRNRRCGEKLSEKPWAVFRQYGWLIEVFLQKMETNVGRGHSLRRLSFMAEAFQSSLRYICYIQVAQILQSHKHSHTAAISAFVQMKGEEFISYDYLSLLLQVTHMIPQDMAFMPELHAFVANLSETTGTLYGTALFLERKRELLLRNAILENDLSEELLEEYLTALVYWLRNLSFLACYRLVSIKDIQLNYRFGTPKNFIHQYGELHGMYTEAQTEGMDYNAYSVEDVFTFNQSVLLLKGSNVERSLANIDLPGHYLSLSPLIIDQSVFTEKQTQTPEVFYYAGLASNGQCYHFEQYKNELSYAGRSIPTNKKLLVRAQNNHQPKLDELHGHLEQLIKPFKATQP